VLLREAPQVMLAIALAVLLQPLAHAESSAELGWQLHF
jgi:hypothetical protein